MVSLCSLLVMIVVLLWLMGTVLCRLLVIVCWLNLGCVWCCMFLWVMSLFTVVRLVDLCVILMRRFGVGVLVTFRRVGCRLGLRLRRLSWVRLGLRMLRLVGCVCRMILVL